MPSQEDPEITIRNAQVSAFFPGMPTDQVENLLVKPSKEIKEIPEVEEFKSCFDGVILRPKLLTVTLSSSPSGKICVTK